MAWYGLVWWDAWGTMVKHIHFLKQCFWFSLLWPTCQDFLIPLRHLSKIQCRIVFFCPCALKWLFLKMPEAFWKHTGRWYTYPSEKYEFVNWDHCSQYMEKHVANVITGNPKKGWLEIHWFFCFNRFWYKDIETKWKQHLSILLRSAQFHA